MNAGESAAFRLPDRVLIRDVEGEMVLLNLDSEQYYGLDAVGADIVRRLTAEPFERVLDALARDYEVDEQVLRADVDRLTAELLEAGLLQRATPRPA